jgi:hypothetical protein
MPVTRADRSPGRGLTTLVVAVACLSSLIMFAWTQVLLLGATLGAAPAVLGATARRQPGGYAVAVVVLVGLAAAIPASAAAGYLIGRDVDLAQIRLAALPGAVLAATVLLLVMLGRQVSWPAVSVVMIVALVTGWGGARLGIRVGQRLWPAPADRSPSQHSYLIEPPR